MQVGKAEIWNKVLQSYNTAYTLWAYDFALRNIAPFGRNVVYAETVIRNRTQENIKS
jgi:hypothetical protein